MFTVYGVLFSPLWLKSVPGWPAISVSTWQQFHVGQIVWFGWLSAISQLASRMGEGGGVWQLCLHSVTQPTLPGPGGKSREGGYVPSPCGFPTLLNFCGDSKSCLCSRRKQLYSFPRQLRERGKYIRNTAASSGSLYNHQQLMRP